MKVCHDDLLTRFKLLEAEKDNEIKLKDDEITAQSFEIATLKGDADEEWESWYYYEKKKRKEEWYANEEVIEQLEEREAELEQQVEELEQRVQELDDQVRDQRDQQASQPHSSNWKSDDWTTSGAGWSGGGAVEKWTKEEKWSSDKGQYWSASAWQSNPQAKWK